MALPKSAGGVSTMIAKPISEASTGSYNLTGGTSMTFLMLGVGVGTAFSKWGSSGKQNNLKTCMG